MLDVDQARQDLLIHAWNEARRTVEALDRSMITIRQLYFVVIGICAAALTNILKDSTVSDHILLVCFSLTFLIVISFSLQQMDTHYHRYQREGAKVAREIEEELGLADGKKLGISIRLEELRNLKDMVKSHKVRDTMYFFPAFGAVTSMIYCLIVTNAQLDGVSYRMALMAATFSTGLVIGVASSYFGFDVNMNRLKEKMKKRFKIV